MTDPDKNPDLDDTRFAEETNPGKRDEASEEELVEQFEEESFPASDPPANY
ncbi:MAG: hypothetical protein Q4G50_01525 [Corynebacterium sp.]|uniref:hypothetical protein n=1 Tax=Corynebacterium sp. TaxID=1720 RepID=UPI0026DEDE51|nr:hypothetical protein [Corynebacterium sp.]MDO5668660.1 hypothetical protein [Corynebacterium sp.]